MTEIRFLTFARFGFALALAVAIAPSSASANLDTCAKKVSKQVQDVAEETRARLGKCVDQYAKEVRKAESAVAGGTSEFKAFKDVGKSVPKCQENLDELGLNGQDIAEKSKKDDLGKAYKALKGLEGGACKDEDLTNQGYISPALSELTWARQAIATGVAQGWSAQLASNPLSVGAFSAMTKNRCAKSGVTCVDDSDCDASNAKDTCQASKCLDCGKWGRSQQNGGNTVGACYAVTCDADDGSSALDLDSSLATIFTLETESQLPLTLCDLPEVLPDSYNVSGGAVRGFVWNDPGSSTVCLDVAGVRGYIKKSGSALPSVDVTGCTDTDTTSDECASSTSCLDTADGKTCTDAEPAAAPNDEGDALIAITARVTPGPTNNDFGPDGVPCTDDDPGAPGEVMTLTLTSGAAQAMLYAGGGGSPGTFTPGTFSPGTMVLGGTVITGSPFNMDADGLDVGRVEADLVTSFSLVNVSGDSYFGDAVGNMRLACGADDD